MGLDNFWKCNIHPKFEPPLNLCGGMFSSYGQESFRGKVYAKDILEITGIDIYENLDTDMVGEVAVKLKRYRELKPDNIKDLDDLIRMFEEYYKIGATLQSWY